MCMHHWNQLLQQFNVTPHLFFLVPLLSSSLWGHHYSTKSHSGCSLTKSLTPSNHSFFLIKGWQTQLGPCSQHCKLMTVTQPTPLWSKGSVNKTCQRRTVSLNNSAKTQKVHCRVECQASALQFQRVLWSRESHSKIKWHTAVRQGLEMTVHFGHNLKLLAWCLSYVILYLFCI